MLEFGSILKMAISLQNLFVIFSNTTHLFSILCLLFSVMGFLPGSLSRYGNYGTMVSLLTTRSNSVEFPYPPIVLLALMVMWKVLTMSLLIVSLLRRCDFIFFSTFGPMHSASRSWKNNIIQW